MFNTVRPKMPKSTVFASFFHLIESFFYLIHGREKGPRSSHPGGLVLKCAPLQPKVVLKCSVNQATRARSSSWTNANRVQSLAKLININRATRHLKRLRRALYHLKPSPFIEPLRALDGRDRFLRKMKAQNAGNDRYKLF